MISPGKQMLAQLQWADYVAMVLGCMLALSMMYLPNFTLADDYRLIGLQDVDKLIASRGGFFESNRMIWYILLDQYLLSMISTGPLVFFLYNAAIFMFGYMGYWAVLRRLHDPWISLLLLLCVVITPTLSDVFYRLSPVEKYYFLLTPYLFLSIPQQGSKHFRSYAFHFCVVLLFVSVKELGFILLFGLGLYIWMLDRGMGGVVRYARLIVVIVPMFIFLMAVALSYDTTVASHAENARPHTVFEIVVRAMIGGGNAMLFSPIVLGALAIFMTNLWSHSTRKCAMLLGAFLIPTVVYLFAHVALGVGSEYRYYLPVQLILLYPLLQCFQEAQLLYRKVTVVVLVSLLLNSGVMFVSHAYGIKEGALRYQEFLEATARIIGSGRFGDPAVLCYLGFENRNERHVSIERYLIDEYGVNARVLSESEYMMENFVNSSGKDSVKFHKERNVGYDLLVCSWQDCRSNSRLFRGSRHSNYANMTLLYSNIGDGIVLMNPPLNVVYRHAINMFNHTDAGSFFKIYEYKDYGWSLYAN